MRFKLYGIDYPCYGEYKCIHCYRRWASNVAWRHEGQECQVCEISVKPFETEPLFSFFCPKEGCGLMWVNKKVPESKCNACQTPGLMFESPQRRHEYILAHYLLDPDSMEARFINSRTTKDGEPDKHHLYHLCERCQKSPLKNCRRVKTDADADHRKSGNVRKAEPSPSLV